MDSAFVRDVLGYAMLMLPWWQGVLLVLAAGLVYALGKRYQPPVVTEPPPSPPLPVQPDGSIHLDQKPPENYL